MPDLLLLATWSIVWIVVAGVSLIALAACAAVLFRQGKTLKRTLDGLQEETRPLTEDISVGAARAAETSERLQRRRP
jgi:hypothetical protein